MVAGESNLFEMQGKSHVHKLMCESTEKCHFKDKPAAGYGQRYVENLRPKQPLTKRKSSHTAKKPLKAMFRTSYWPITEIYT